MDYAGELLESRAFQRALEGDVEPIVYMGVVVGHIRKFDSKLQIEMLRAYRPERFKTPGNNVNIGVKGDVFVLTEDQRHKLQEITRARLDRENMGTSGSQIIDVSPTPVLPMHTEGGE